MPTEASDLLCQALLFFSLNFWSWGQGNSGRGVGVLLSQVPRDPEATAPPLTWDSEGLRVSRRGRGRRLVLGKHHTWGPFRGKVTVLREAS